MIFDCFKATTIVFFFWNILSIWNESGGFARSLRIKQKIVNRRVQEMELIFFVNDLFQLYTKQDQHRMIDFISFKNAKELPELKQTFTKISLFKLKIDLYFRFFSN